MNDITVQEIVSTFKNIKRDVLYSTTQTDDFIDLMKKKNHWTFEEYKEFYLEYALQNMNIGLMDLRVIRPIKEKYNFKLDWNDYFNIIENIKAVSKQKKYINYYFWYHGQDMNENIYNELMKKPYFSLLNSKSKSHFLGHALKTDNSNNWFIHYFNTKEIADGLKKSTLSINLYASANNVTLEKIENVKNFYNRYEIYMDYKTKVKFFHEAVRTGVIPLIQFLYLEKNIRKLNLVKLLWHVCGDISSKNTVEILQCLKEIGIKLTPSVLKKIQENYQWGYMENTDILVNFIIDPIREKNYLKLDKKLPNKPEGKSVIKI